MNNQLPVSMHPRYNDFLKFMENCPYRKTPSTMETAFWAWLIVIEDLEKLLHLSDELALQSKELIDEMKEYNNQIGAL